MAWDTGISPSIDGCQFRPTELGRELAGAVASSPLTHDCSPPRLADIGLRGPPYVAFRNRQVEFAAHYRDVAGSSPAPATKALVRGRSRAARAVISQPLEHVTRLAEVDGRRPVAAGGQLAQPWPFGKRPD